MRTSILIMSLAVAAMAFTSCNKDENETVVDNWNGEIRLSSGVTVQTRANGVPDTQIAAGQNVQVVVTKQSGDESTYSGYSQALTAQGDGTFAAPTTAMYYPGSGKGVSIYAYHPSAADASFVTSTDQSMDENYYNSDLLYSAAADYARKSTAHPLTFEHKLSKLTYELAAGEGKPELDNATVTWTNVCNTAEFNKATGGVTTPTNATTIAPHATHGAIIVPQTVAKGKVLMTVKIEGVGTLIYKPDTDQTFEGGKKYHYKITVNRTDLTVQSSIADWTTGDPIEGTAELPMIGSKTIPGDAERGDFYFSDGSLESGAAELTTDQKAACIGVVYCVNQEFIKASSTNKETDYTHGLVVALKDATPGSCLWDRCQEYMSDYTIGTPTYSSGWYSPNWDELKYICWGNDTEKSTDGKVFLNNQFQKVGSENAVSFENAYYWANEVDELNADVVHFNSGTAQGNVGKGNGSYGRVVLAF